MHELDIVIEQIRDTMLFHRHRARVHFWAMAVLATTVFIGALVFSGYLIQLLQTTATLISVANANGITTSSPPDLTQLASEHTLGYVMVSGFVLMLFVVTGLLRYHVKRATISEDRLYHLLKVASLRTPEEGLSTLAQQSLLDLRENVQASLADAEAHAGLSVIERSLQALTESISGIAKRAGK